MRPDHRPSSAQRRGPGLVSIVGAGPGDAELLTVRAVRRLEEAELVLHDALVSQEALEMATQARRFCVGKRAGQGGVDQASIHRMLVRAARAGKRVVRLKSGDPFVLGRGGEEVLALAQAGIRCEVVPGVSSLLAAPGLAGIPLTHRGLASGFVMVSGHDEESYRPILEQLPAGSLTLAILMGLANRAPIARLLLDQGWDPETPSAMLLGASTPAAFSWIGPLRALERSAIPPPWAAAPGMLVIGEVVAIPQEVEAALDRRRPSPAGGAVALPSWPF